MSGRHLNRRYERIEGFILWAASWSLLWLVVFVVVNGAAIWIAST